MVQMFTSRPELLDREETTAEHLRLQREEAQRLENDKSDANLRTGGLFKGAFKPRHSNAFRRPILDVEDNVLRCPHCSWELEEDSACEQCGYQPDSTSDYMTDGEDDSVMTDYYDDEAADGVDDFDSHDFWNDVYHGRPFDALPPAIQEQLADWHPRVNWRGLHSNRRPPSPAPPDVYRTYADDEDEDEDEEEEEDENGEDSEMDSFIDDGEIVREGSELASDPATVVGGYVHSTQDHYNDMQPGAAGSVSQVEDDQASSVYDESVYEEDHSGLETDYGDEDEDEDEEPIQPPVRRVQHPDTHVHMHRPPLAHQQYDPPSSSFNAGYTASDAINVDDDSDSDEEPTIPVRRQRSRIY